MEDPPDDHSHHSTSESTSVDMPISVRRGTAYLRKQHVRTRAYSELYYENVSWWKRWYYFLHFLYIAVNFGGSIAALLQEDSQIAKYVASATGILAGSLGVINMTVNPGRETKISEDAGDSYKDVAEDLELFDPQAISEQGLDTLVNKTKKRLKKLRNEYTEPDHTKLDAKKHKIVERIKRAKEALLYLPVDENNNIVNSALADLDDENTNLSNSKSTSPSQNHHQNIGIVIEPSIPQRYSETNSLKIGSQRKRRSISRNTTLRDLQDGTL